MEKKLSWLNVSTYRVTISRPDDVKLRCFSEVFHRCPAHAPPHIFRCLHIGVKPKPSRLTFLPVIIDMSIQVKCWLHIEGNSLVIASQWYHKPVKLSARAPNNLITCRVLEILCDDRNARTILQYSTQSDDTSVTRHSYGNLLYGAKSSSSLQSNSCYFHLYCKVLHRKHKELSHYS